MNLRSRWYRFWTRPALSWGEVIVGVVLAQLATLLPTPLRAIMFNVLLLVLLVFKASQYKIVRRHPRARKEA